MADRDGRLRTAAHGAALPLTANLSAAYDWRARHRTVPGRGGHWTRYSVPVVDLALGTVFLAFALESVTFILRFGGYAVYIADFALCLALALAQFGRLRFLRASFIATYALLAAYAILVALSPVNLGLNPIIATAITSLYTVTRWEPDRRWGTAALLLALAGALVNPVTLASYTRPYESDTNPMTNSGWNEAILVARTLTGLVFVGAVVLTYLLASSRRRIAENQALDVGIAAAQAVAAERLSLARELHDLVGHSLTTIKVQAATGLALGGEERLRSTLTTVRDTADASLASVRRLVSVLRSDAGEITPLADLRTIPALIETTRSSGSRISAALPEPEVLDHCNSAWSAIQRLTLVRLVGETLTNAVRHGTGQIEMSLTLSQDSCHLHVTNPVPDVVEHSPFGGSGLAGLEERLRLVGGTMTYGVHDDEDHSIFTIDVDFPVAPLELPASATVAGETASGDSR
ncbi:sensor histidine kinase [Actinomyces oris]|uniref:histidine kinase n=1 Tax=Actinomyces oris TaxID=544580 RepID=A0A1Q8I169_9ACTO|nr:histidine kinase [Actinomyces oris]OLL14843.1 two-component sensor histidine kinase [Actinomyces oris]